MARLGGDKNTITVNLAPVSICCDNAMFSTFQFVVGENWHKRAIPVDWLIREELIARNID